MRKNGKHFSGLAWIRALAGSVSAIGHAAAVVGLVLFKHADNETGMCWPSLSTIAKEGRVSKTSVVRGLAALEAAKLLKKKKVPRKAGGRWMNIYTLTTQGNSVSTVRCKVPLRHHDGNTTVPELSPLNCEVNSESVSTGLEPEWTVEDCRRPWARSALVGSRGRNGAGKPVGG